MKFAKLTASILAIAALCTITTTVEAAPMRGHARRSSTYVCTYNDCNKTGVHQHNNCYYTSGTTGITSESNTSDNTATTPAPGTGCGQGRGNRRGNGRHHR